MPRPLAELTTLRLGGPARRLVEARSEAEIVAAVRAADAAGEPLLVLSGGSNVVVADAGPAASVVRVASRGERRRPGGPGELLVEVAAGEPWDPFVARCVDDGLGGVECLSGIPGSVGATPVQNVGAYGQEVAGTIRTVRALDRREDRVLELSAADCGFGYRSSRFKREAGRWVVLCVTFALAPGERSGPVRYPELARALGIDVGERAPLHAVRAAVLELRRGKGMVLDPDDPDSASAGSFFTNPVLAPDDYARLVERARERLGPGDPPPAYPQPDGQIKTSAAWLIERAGFSRGHGDALGVAISSKHTLALTNRGAGTAEGLVALAREIAAGVQREFGVALEPEPVFVGHAWG